MARKGWDALSDAYRGRLQSKGIGQAAYESGASLHKARGHTSQAKESFTRRVGRFVQSHATGDAPHTRGREIQAMEAEDLAAKIRGMGPQKAQAYMDYRREMTRRYERGDYEGAKRMYEKRPKGSAAHMYWYHGMFGE